MPIPPAWNSGVVIAGMALAVLVKTRYLPLRTIAGIMLLIGGGALLLQIDPAARGIKLMAAAGMLGLDAGATVSPGLWMAGFSLPSQMVGRTFALVELVRSDADYLLSPVLLKVAEVSSGGRPLHARGVEQAVWIALVIAIAFTALGMGLYLWGTRRLPQPDLQGWLKEGRTAFESPKFGAGVAVTVANRPKPGWAYRKRNIRPAPSAHSASAFAAATTPP